MSDFYVGQKVVCVPDGLAAGGCLERIRNKIVPILAITQSCHVGLLLCVYADGYPTSCSVCGKDHGGEFYGAEYFRPLDNLEEQIEAIEEEGAPVELEPEYA